MDEREGNAHKNTKNRPFANSLSQTGVAQQTQQPSSKSRFGLGKLFGHSSTPPPQQQAQSIIPPRGVQVHTPAPAQPPSIDGIDLNDPAVQAVLQDLKAMGITEDQIEEHTGFIKEYLAQHKAQAAIEADRKSRAPPPPPPADISPQHTGSSGNSKRGPPPAAPPPRRGVTQRPPSPPESPQRAPSPPRPRFRVPPVIADAGKFAHDEPKIKAPTLPSREAASPAAPPRPPKEPLDDHKAGFAVPPPFAGTRLPANTGAPPPPPARSSGPPPPPREANVPPPPPREAFVPPPPPREASVPQPPPREAYVPPPPPRIPGLAEVIPPAPPLPSAPRPQAPSSGAPVPPPLPPTSSGPPPPPPMPPRTGDGDAPALPKADEAGRGGLLADIRGGPRLRKVADTEKRDRSAALVPGSESSAPAPATPGAAPGGDAQGGLAGALASALAARKSKVAHSDDEDDNDDW